MTKIKKFKLVLLGKLTKYSLFECLFGCTEVFIPGFSPPFGDLGSWEGELMRPFLEAADLRDNGLAFARAPTATSRRKRPTAIRHLATRAAS